MKNILDILKGIGVEIPEDKSEEFNTSFNANYKTINEVTAINTKLTNLQSKYDTDIKSRDTDLAELKKNLEEAGTDKTKLEELTAQVKTLQTSYDEAKTEYEKQLATQQYEFLVKEKVNALKFTSNGAKKAFTDEVIAKNLSVQDGKLLGFDEYVEAYKQSDVGAFVVESQEQQTKPPTFVTKTTPNPDPQPEAKEIPRVW